MEAAGSSDCLKTLDELVHDTSFEKLPQDKKVPIVLVPGFSGWGAPLLGSLNYWGGVEDIPNLLLSKGYTVIVSSIAPLSSNWERACELYRELTCGKFILFNADDKEIREGYDLDISYGDYFDENPPGPKETETNHRKRAILFTNDVAAYKHWTWSQANKAHFICHSQGGTTVRLLISLMAHGDHRQQKYFGKPGRDDWAISVTTLGTPHKGTTICDVIPRLFSANPAVGNEAIVLLGRLFATVAYKAPALQVYDLQLGHWGIGRQGIESFQQMRTRLEDPNGPVRRWALSRHNAFYDNSIIGVSELPKSTTEPSEHIYYFTLSFHATVPFPLEYPAWGPQAAATFPVSLLQFAREVLRHIPVIGGPTHWISSKFVAMGPPTHWILSRFNAIVGWDIFSSIVQLRDLVFWMTTDVTRRLLQGMGYNLTLPPPGRYLPRKDVFAFMLPTVYAMGGQELSDEEKKILGPNRGDWYLNDGIVNTPSMDGPVGTEVFDISGFPKSNPEIGGPRARGRYWHFGVNDKMDHADEIGVWIQPTTAHAMVHMYENLAGVLSRLRPA